MTLKEMIALYEHQSMTSTLGIKFTGTTAESLEAQVTVSEIHSRPGGIANGGLALVLIESLGSLSACFQIDFVKYNALGIGIDANHISVARMGDVLTARSKAIHVGRTTQVWEVSIHNQKQKLVSSGRVTLLIVER